MITNVNGLITNDQNGYINVTNKAAFLAGCSVSYMYNGQPHIETVNYFPVLQSHFFVIPQGATNIIFKAICWVDFTLSIPVCTKNFGSTIPQNCYYLWGTIAYKGCAETPCGGNGPSVGGPVPPTNPCCCCCCCKC